MTYISISPEIVCGKDSNGFRSSMAVHSLIPSTKFDCPKLGMLRMCYGRECQARSRPLGKIPLKLPCYILELEIRQNFTSFPEKLPCMSRVEISLLHKRSQTRKNKKERKIEIIQYNIVTKTCICITFILLVNKPCNHTS